MPDTAVRPPDMDTVTALCPAPAAIIVCGRLPGDVHGTDLADALPCFQALGPWGEPDAGLPWFRMGVAASAPAHGAIHAASPAIASTLADLLHRAAWLLLVIGDDHDALASALAMATIARGRGIHVIALAPGKAPLHGFPHKALAQRVDYACACPPGVDRLVAAQVLWSGISKLARSGPDPAAATSALAGQGRMAWTPLREAGTDALQAALRGLPVLRAKRCLWAVLLHRDGVSPQEQALASQWLRAQCGDNPALVATSPDGGRLPDGLFVFTA